MLQKMQQQQLLPFQPPPHHAGSCLSSFPFFPFPTQGDFASSISLEGTCSTSHGNLCQFSYWLLEEVEQTQTQCKMKL